MKRPNFNRSKARKRLRQRDGDLCCWCHHRMSFDYPPLGVKRPDNLATIEHVIPLSEGGAHDEGNMALACQRCNTTRQGRARPMLAAAQ